jgi:hypothetical protein
LFDCLWYLYIHVYMYVYYMDYTKHIFITLSGVLSTSHKPHSKDSSDAKVAGNKVWKANHEGGSRQHDNARLHCLIWKWYLSIRADYIFKQLLLSIEISRKIKAIDL